MDIDFALLERTLTDATKRGKRVPMLLYTNPHNPTGVIFPRETTERVIAFCLRHRVHLVSDEIYALSILNSPATIHTFVSAYEIISAEPERYPGTLAAPAMWTFMQVQPPPPASPHSVLISQRPRSTFTSFTA